MNDKELNTHWEHAMQRPLPMGNNAALQLGNATLRGILPALYSIAFSLSRIALALEHR